MNSNWQKKGRIFVPSGEGFFKTHATRPMPYRRSDEVLRLFFISRDDQDVPHPTYIDVDIDNPSRVLHVNEKPMMPLGRRGTFDDSGISPTCILRRDGEDLLYYSGWKRRRINVTIESMIGVARLTNGGDTLEKLFEGPILGQDRYNPLLTAAPFVLYEDGLYRMWYCSGTDWVDYPGYNDPEMIYTVFYAESDNGLDWRSTAKPVIPFAYEGEVVSSPWVERGPDGYRMWYSTRGSANREAKQYRPGYAESPDGLNWTRKDELAGFDRSPEGWDSEMACYPAFYDHGDRRYLFYSGNGVGRGGIGWAEQVRDTEQA